MGKSFVYNTGSAEDLIATDELHLNFGVFIDGTLNNMYNTDRRTEYARGGKDKPNWKLTNSQIEESDEEEYEKVPNKSRIGKLLDIENRNDKEQAELERYPKKDVYLVASKRGFMDKLGTDNSYSNDYTNVARMWTCCGEEYKIYIDGMGTTKFGKDDQDGFAFGAGSKSGIRARVRMACETLAARIKEENNKNNEKKLTQITLDVFGFSRGAASARNFVSEVNFNKGVYKVEKIRKYGEEIKEVYQEVRKMEHDRILEKRGIDNNSFILKTNTVKKEPINNIETPSFYKDRDGMKVEGIYIVNNKMPNFGHLGISLLKLGVVDKPEDLNDITLTVRFLGIYDTVSSYGEIGDLGGDSTEIKGAIHLVKSYFTNDEAELNLQNMGTVQQIVHFTAKDEHRENFALTRVDKKYSIKNNDGSNRLIERNLPGVHCDIGGAYMSEPENIDEIETTAFLIPKGFRTQRQELEILRQKLIDNYWFTEEQIKITNSPIKYPAKVVELFSLISRAFKSFFLINQLAYDALTSNRDVRKEYSFIPLHFMEEYFKTFIEQENMPDSAVEIYSIKNLPVLVQAKAYIKQHVLLDNREWEFATDAELLAMKKMKDANLYEQHETVKDNISSTRPKVDYEKDQAYAKEHQRTIEESRKEYLENRAMVREEGKYVSSENETRAPTVYAWEEGYPEREEEPTVQKSEKADDNQALLRILRNQYFHWSSNRDWLGMDHCKNFTRVEYPLKK